MIFAFDSSRQFLIYPDPVTGQPRAMHVKELVEFWEPKATMEGELRRCLPRFGKPEIEVVPSLAGLKR